ncbi:MAG: hypothetical protein VB142_02825 [Burkholderia sp.]
MVRERHRFRCRHLNFFPYDCFLEVRTLRIKLPDGRVALVEPEWAGKAQGASRCCSRQWY